jgi:hypothetical protein
LYAVEEVTVHLGNEICFIESPVHGIFDHMAMTVGCGSYGRLA